MPHDVDAPARLAGIRRGAARAGAAMHAGLRRTRRHLGRPLPARAAPPVVACISLEPWDDTWRRNQHFASRLVDQGLVARLIFLEPPVPGRGRGRRSPRPGVEVVRPALVLPKRAGGLQLAGLIARLTLLRGVEVLWINDPTLGRYCLGKRRAVYDVTDDWREFDQPPHITRRMVAAEDALATSARTVVCSAVLAERWLSRYGVVAPIVRNAVDLDAVAKAVPVELSGLAPHVGYVGTLHPHRLDVDLVLALARELPGTLHLVGPDSLTDAVRGRLRAEPRLRLEPAVPGPQVPAWIGAMDVLVCPHLVNDFTLSLDAIKAHEYLATARPVVATPSSGFQSLRAPGLRVVGRDDFVQAVRDSLGSRSVQREAVGWDARTREFAAVLWAEP